MGEGGCKLFEEVCTIHMTETIIKKYCVGAVYTCIYTCIFIWMYMSVVYILEYCTIVWHYVHFAYMMYTIYFQYICKCNDVSTYLNSTYTCIRDIKQRIITSVDLQWYRFYHSISRVLTPSRVVAEVYAAWWYLAAIIGFGTRHRYWHYCHHYFLHNDYHFQRCC